MHWLRMIEASLDGHGSTTHALEVKEHEVEKVVMTLVPLAESKNARAKAAIDACIEKHTRSWCAQNVNT